MNNRLMNRYTELVEKLTDTKIPVTDIYLFNFKEDEINVKTQKKINKKKIEIKKYQSNEKKDRKRY